MAHLLAALRGRAWGDPIRTTGQKAWHSVYSVEGDFHLLKLFLPAIAAAKGGGGERQHPVDITPEKKLSHFGQETPVYSTHTLLHEDKQSLICQSLKGQQHRINNWSRNVNSAVYHHQARFISMWRSVFLLGSLFIEHSIITLYFLLKIAGGGEGVWEVFKHSTFLPC